MVIDNPSHVLEGRRTIMQDQLQIHTCLDELQHQAFDFFADDHLYVVIDEYTSPLPHRYNDAELLARIFQLGELFYGGYYVEHKPHVSCMLAMDLDGNVLVDLGSIEKGELEVRLLCLSSSFWRAKRRNKLERVRLAAARREPAGESPNVLGTMNGNGVRYPEAN